MKLKIFYILIFILVMFLAGPGCQSSVVGPDSGVLRNGNAQHGMEFWSYSDGVVRSIDENDQSTGTVLPRSGNFFFDMTGTIVPPAFVAYMSQDVDIPASDTKTFNAGGWVQTELWPDPNKTDVTDNDYGEFVLTFKDANGFILQTVSSGPIGNPVKGFPDTNGRQYKEFSLKGDIPSGAATVVYELKGYLIQGEFINVYYDDLYFFFDR